MAAVPALTSSNPGAAIAPARAYRTSLLTGYPTQIPDQYGNDPYWMANTELKQYEDSMHGPWAHGKRRYAFLDIVFEHIIGMDGRSVYKIFPIKNTETNEFAVQRTEYPEHNAHPAPEFQPVPVVEARGNSWTYKTERWGLGCIVGSLYSATPEAAQELQFAIRQIEESFLLKGELLIYNLMNSLPSIAYFVWNARANSNVSAAMTMEELVAFKNSLFGMISRSERAISNLFQEAASVPNPQGIQLDTAFLPRGCINHLGQKLKVQTASQIGEDAFKKSFDPHGNEALVIGGRTILESRRMDYLQPMIGHTEPLSERAIIGSYFAVDVPSNVLADDDLCARIGAYVHDNPSDSMVFISVKTMKERAYRCPSSIGLEYRAAAEEIHRKLFQTDPARAKALYDHLANGGDPSEAAQFEAEDDKEPSDATSIEDAEHLQPTVRFLLLRTNDRRHMGPAIMTKIGGAVGFTSVCNQGFEVGHDADRELSKLSARTYIGPVCITPELILRIPCVAFIPRGYIGGGGTTIADLSKTRLEAAGEDAKVVARSLDQQEQDINNAIDAIYREEVDGPNQADMICIMTGAADTLPVHFYPYPTWGSDGPEQNKLPYFLRETFRRIFRKELLLQQREFIDLDPSRGSDRATYLEVVSRGFQVTVSPADPMDANNTKVVRSLVQGRGKEGPANGYNYRAAREMLSSSATQFITDSSWDENRLLQV